MDKLDMDIEMLEISPKGVDYTAKVKLPKDTAYKVYHVAKTKGYSYNSIVQMAVDFALRNMNECFDFDYSWSSEDHEAGKYAKEASLLLKYLNKFDDLGCTAFQLVMYREEFFVKSPTAVLGALQELHINGLVETVANKRSNFKTPSGEFWRVKGIGKRTKDVMKGVL